MLSSLIPYLLTAGAAFAVLLGIIVKSRRDGARLERARQAAGKLQAAEDRLEMDREATAEERKASDMSDEAARREAIRWARK